MDHLAGIAIRLARATDAAQLPAVEGAAGALFRTLPELAWVADEPLGAPAEFLPLIAAGTVWVAEHGQAGVIGELRAEICGNALHILELAVTVQFQQRGIGRRLLDAARDAARERGLRALTLTTFRHVAWNAPFYARYGFVEVPQADIDERLAGVVHAEEARGLPNRCAMRMTLAEVR